MKIEENLKKLNIELPEAPSPVGAYVAYKVINNLVCLDGCVTCDQVLWAYKFTNGKKISTTGLVRN